MILVYDDHKVTKSTLIGLIAYLLRPLGSQMETAEPTLDWLSEMAEAMKFIFFR